MIRDGARLLLCLVAAASAADAQAPHVVLRRPGPGRPGRIVREALAAPHELRLAVDSAIHLPRDSVFERTVLVLGGDVAVGASVRGDVIVVDGDLYLRPGAVIDGRAIAIGGCVYNSALAEVRAGRECFRDVTLAVTSLPGGVWLDYRELGARQESRVVTLPLIYGLRPPEYNRVDGLSLAWGPRVTLETSRIAIDPIITYRSDRGALDASVGASARLRRRYWADTYLGRTTLSNDRWIYSDLLNSISSLVSGHDVRNYYRADRVVARLGRAWEGETATLSAWVGGLTERAWSASAGGPWSLQDRRDAEDGMLRPNPPVRRGRTTSALIGLDGSWSQMQVRTTFAAMLELPAAAPGDARFTQLTAHAGVRFPTFGAQSFRAEAHGVLTFGDTAPPQRFAYLGGSGTLRTLGVLEQGGDQLFYVEARYIIPIERWRLPLVGPPELALRELLGSAGLGTLPRLVQNVGARVTVRPLRVEYLIDPVSRDHALSFGVTFGR